MSLGIVFFSVIVPSHVLAAAFDCSTNANGVNGVNTAIGCIPTNDLGPFLIFFLKWGVGISGGVMLLMLMMTGYNLLFSGGNPEKLQAARENMVSIFSGFVLIVFSLVLLQTIGANVLGLLPFVK